jgi:hypothetical protein
MTNLDVECGPYCVTTGHGVKHDHRPLSAHSEWCSVWGGACDCRNDPPAIEYAERVQQMADALHQDCTIEANARYAVDPVPDPWQGDLHDSTRHYARAHDLVRRLWPQLDRQ